MNKKWLLSIMLLCIAIVLTLGACSSSTEDISSEENTSSTSGSTQEAEDVYPKLELKLGHLATEQSNYQQLALRFKEKVEEQSGGNITVAIFPHRQLGGDRELMEAMQINSVDLGIITASPISNFVPEFFVHDLPFVFKDWNHVNAYLESDTLQDVLKETEKAGFKSFALMARGYQTVVNSKRPVQTPEDFKGLKIRVIESPFYVKGYQALGPNVISMSFGESFTAAQQGAIDGMENTLDVIHDEKLYEVTKYASELKINFAFANFMASKDIYEKWPENVQKLISESAISATAEMNEINPEAEMSFKEKLEEQGMVFNEVDTELFRPMVDSVYEEFTNEFGDKYLSQIEALRQ